MQDTSVVHYFVMHENEQPFVSKYRLALPVKCELRVELKRERLWLAEQKRSEGKNVF
jgi:hypothetical protein